MSIINLDFKNSIKITKIKSCDKKIATIYNSIKNRTAVGSEWLGWYEQPININDDEIDQILKCANRIKKLVKHVVVIGIGGSYLGAKAGIDFVKGSRPNDDEVEIIWMGHTISSTYIKQQITYLADKDFAVIVISKSGTTIEPALSFNLLRKMIEKKHPTNSYEYIVAVTDEKTGLLNEIATKQKYEKFIIPSNIGGRYSVFTPVGLLPFALAGLDIKKMLEGLKEAYDHFAHTPLKNNLATQYAVARFLLSKNASTEIFCFYEPQFAMFAEWLKQLFGESEGKNNKGIWPASVNFSTDLHSLGQYIQEGKKSFFQTVFWLETPLLDHVLKTRKDGDGLAFLENKSIHEVNSIAFKATLKAHAQTAKIPNNVVIIDDMSEKTFGFICYFFFIACAYYCYMLKVNPFNQPGVEVYKKFMKEAW